MHHLSASVDVKMVCNINTIHCFDVQSERCLIHRDYAVCRVEYNNTFQLLIVGQGMRRVDGRFAGKDGKKLREIHNIRSRLEDIEQQHRQHACLKHKIAWFPSHANR